MTRIVDRIKNGKRVFGRKNKEVTKEDVLAAVLKLNDKVDETLKATTALAKASEALAKAENSK